METIPAMDWLSPGQPVVFSVVVGIVYLALRSVHVLVAANGLEMLQLVKYYIVKSWRIQKMELLFFHAQLNWIQLAGSAVFQDITQTP